MAALNRPLDLVCHDELGSGVLSDPSQLLWYKDGEEVPLGEGEASLHFPSLLPSDGGVYNCEAVAPGRTGVFSRAFLLSCE